MFSPESFAHYTQWCAIATVGFALLAGLAFWRNAGFRFRLVGVTGFMGVLTVGLFSLSIVPLTRVSIPNAVRYTLVYDSGGPETVIAVAPTITETQLNATLEQATYDLFSPGRLGGDTQQLHIRARTILHPEKGVSEPVFLGEVRRSLIRRDDPNLSIQVFADQLKRLPQDN